MIGNIFCNRIIYITGLRICLYIFLQNLLIISLVFATSNSDIYHAAIKGKLDEVLSLIDKGVDVNAIDKNGMTPLIYAAREGHTLLVEALLNKGANASLKDKNGNTAIDWLTLRRNNDLPVDATTILRIQNDIKVLQLQSEQNEKTLGIYFNAFTLILASFGAILTILGFIGFKSIKKFTLDYIKKKIDENTNDDSLKKRIEEKIRKGVFVVKARSDIFYFIEEGNKNELRKVLKGVDVNTKNNYGRTALMEAVIKGKLDIVKILLSKNADLDKISKESGKTAVIYAAEHGHKEILRFLIRKGADVNIETKYSGTALRCAVAKNNLDMVKIILGNSDVDLNAGDKDGWTALAKAAEEGYTNIAKLLIKKDARVDEKDHFGWTPLMKAAIQGHSDMVQLLINKGANVNETNASGNNALTKAMDWNHEDVIKILINAGARKKTKNG